MLPFSSTLKHTPAFHAAVAHSRDHTGLPAGSPGDHSKAFDRLRRLSFCLSFFLADANPRPEQRPKLLTNLTILMAYYSDRLTVKTIKSLAPPVTAIYVCIRIARTP